MSTLNLLSLKKKNDNLMTKKQTKLAFDAASAISQGNREYQEDAIAMDFQCGGRIGFVVVADGMGGHAAGDVASNVVLTEVFSELKLESQNFLKPQYDFASTLQNAATAANESVKQHVEMHPSSHGMGSTLLSMVIVDDRLYWISIGDSPLFLFRDCKLQQLNADHSMAPQIDFMVAEGLMTQDEGMQHPDRNCLTSAITGGVISKIDCPVEPFRLYQGDCIICASDGIQFLDEETISQTVSEYGSANSNSIAEAILDAIEEVDHPEQDNISFSIVNVGHGETNSLVQECRAVQFEPIHEKEDT